MRGAGVAHLRARDRIDIAAYLASLGEAARSLSSRL